MLTEEQVRLIIGNEMLVYLIARKFLDTEIDFEDICSISKIGLIKAAKGFNPKLGFKFSTYATRTIQNEIIDELNKVLAEKRAATVISYDEDLNTTLKWIKLVN